MNTSTQDTYNLAWKLGGVLRKQISPRILSTYESERLPVAREVMSLDRDMARVLFARADRDEAEVGRVHKRLEDHTGVRIRCETSLLVSREGETAKQTAAKNLTLGMRFPDADIWN